MIWSAQILGCLPFSIGCRDGRFCGNFRKMLKRNRRYKCLKMQLYLPTIILMGPDGILSLHNLLKLIHQNFTLVWQTSIAAKNIQKNSKLRKIIRTTVHFLTSDRDRMKGNETSNKVCSINLLCCSSGSEDENEIHP